MNQERKTEEKGGGKREVLQITPFAKHYCGQEREGEGRWAPNPIGRKPEPGGSGRRVGRTEGRTTHKRSLPRRRKKKKRFVCKGTPAEKEKKKRKKKEEPFFPTVDPLFPPLRCSSRPPVVLWCHYSPSLIFLHPSIPLPCPFLPARGPPSPLFLISDAR